MDGRTARHITTVVGEHGFLSELREDLKARRFSPEAVREVMIPKRGGKYRRLGIATVRDRVVQAALKTVLEPILEADFKPCSYGFRRGRRVQDAIAEIHFFTSHSYEWIVEGDIKPCFDEISHVGVQDRLRARVVDKRILLLVKAFLKAGILSREGVERHPITGTPQGGILSPLLSNLALSVLDEHFAAAWESFATDWARRSRRSKGLANYRLVRYADDCVPRTLKEDRCRRRYRRMRCCMRDEGAGPGGLVALRGRPAGGGRKPPRGAPVKSRGAERRGKGVLSARQVWITKASESDTTVEVSKAYR